MPLRRMAVFNRQDFVYESPDGDEWRITFFDTTDRKYIELQKQGEKKVDTWDMEMFLDIADSVRSVIYKQTVVKKRKLKGPNIVDRRGENPEAGKPESIQSAVDEAMKNASDESEVSPVQSFSPAPMTPESLKEDIGERAKLTRGTPSPEKQIRRSGVKADDLI